ncbi:DUF6119 family protein [Cognatiyoonia sp. IB215182]|uniref:DUF6119 family protein n=1 Tax=Cognatiyoonia sp. IB215182 TaxID=3097353 RepID=UPI002A143BC6|nr:DUF6119 family protein [Cognatiyoonia sp. IB215182]MDX8355549.1 DUF6119 family protein [Cognatiyoonia sp. IB215182]
MPTYSLLLAKEDDVDDFEDVFKKDVLNASKDQRLQKIVRAKNADFGEGGELFLFVKNSHPPGWFGQLKANFAIEETINNQSHSAVLVFKSEGRFFVLTFGFSGHMLNPYRLVSDFGLKVSINSLDAGSIKGLERNDLVRAMRSVEHSPISRSINSFRIDEAFELIKKVSGRIDGDGSESSITGAQALRFSSSRKLERIPDYATDAMELYQSDAYTKTPFSIIDTLQMVTDRSKIDELDEGLVASIRSLTDKKFEIGLPEVSDRHAVEYAFTKIRMSGRRPDLFLDDYRKELGADLDDLTVELFKKHEVRAYWDAENGRTDSSLYKLMVGTLEVDDVLYAINDGAWYSLKDSFRTSINASFIKHKSDEPVPFDWPKIVDEGVTAKSKRGVKFVSEDVYNVRACEAFGLVCLDRKLFRFGDDCPHDKFEGCDQMDIAGRKLMHVKRGRRKSQGISYLFDQGEIAARALRQPEYWSDLCDRLETISVDEELVQDARNNGPLNERWTIEFQIADSRNSSGEFTIPFFSRVRFHSAASEIGLDYDVEIKFIDLKGHDLPSSPKDLEGADPDFNVIEPE